MRSMVLAACGLLLAGLAGCQSDAPYANGSPFYDATISANPYPRGSEAFCQQYARQTAANYYDGQSDPGDSFGAQVFTEQRARTQGDAAYRRCRARR
ncbi:hypothetical protein [Jiella sp. M17.18]|uniref:hypothetical protein n=1 Tax=Jiella sp. M17.18 TaxID=3234247 RepID=UPI0034DFFDA1